jgi:hypothetical protein
VARIAQRAGRQERVVSAADRELGVDHARPGEAERLAQLRLGPDGPEDPGAGADHRDRLVAPGVVGERARRPVDRVLEAAGHRAVVLGRRDQDRVRGGDGAAQALDGRGCPPIVVILAVGRQPGDPVEPHVAHAARKRLGRLAQQGGVVRPAPQRTGDEQHLTRQHLRPRA